jgi:hemerythrin-like domain-containing protein
VKRHPGLVSLSHDHHHGLVAARRLRRAADHREPPARAAAVREFLVGFSRDTLRHFDEEERVAFPLLARYAGPEEPLLVRAQEDHIELQALTARLAQDLDAGVAPAGLMRSLAGRLQAHIRLEERELFPLLEQAASAHELRALAADAARLRRSQPSSGAASSRPSASA